MGEFALKKKHDNIQVLATQHDMNAFRAPWDSFFQDMTKTGVFAEGPVLYCAALIIERDIAVISFRNNMINPYMKILCRAIKAYPPIFAFILDPDLCQTGSYMISVINS